MEKKTIGGFIAALRKVSGMTQKDLAERLNVSDKTVSRWERDEGAPDLSLIPVIAEIFGVSCDELLRGERKSPAERDEAAEENATSPKAEKQRQRLLKTALAEYRDHSYIAMVTSGIGLIAALICNLAFLKAVLGFLLGAVFFVISIVLQAMFVNRAYLCVEDAELDEAALFDYKRKVVSLAQKSIGVTVAFVGFTLPLAFVDAYLGLGADSLLLWGGLGAAAFLLVYGIVLYFVNAARIKKEPRILSEKEAAVYHHNRKLKKVCAVILIFLLLVTFIGHEMATELWGPASIMNGTVFHDYESFVEYMEQEVPRSEPINVGREPSASIAIAPDPDGEIKYFDVYGNEISEEESRRRELKDKNGTVVCEYIQRNDNVCRLHYSAQDGTVLPITVSTYDDLYEARAKAEVRNGIFAVAYCAECVLVLAFYFLKRKR